MIIEIVVYEIACSWYIYIYIYDYLMKYVQLMNYDMLLLNCDGIHDYKLWLIVVDNLISWFGYELWLELLLLLNWVVVKNWIVVVVENLLFWKMVLKQFIKHIQLSQNECIRCVRAPGHALDHFWWMGDLTLRFLGENGEDPRPKHAKTRVYGVLHLSKGARRP